MSFLLLAEVRPTDVWDAGELFGAVAMIVILAVVRLVLRVVRGR